MLWTLLTFLFQMLCCSIAQKYAVASPMHVIFGAYHVHPVLPYLYKWLHAHIVICFYNLQPIGRAFALVQPASDRTALTPEPVKSTEEQVEIIKVGVFAHSLLFCFVFLGSSNGPFFISWWCLTSSPLLPFKVYLDARKQEQRKHEQNLKMLSDEVSQIQEVSLHTASTVALMVPNAHQHYCLSVT